MADYTTNYRKEKLLTRISQYEARVAEIERNDKAKNRKKDTRFKVLTGAAFITKAERDNRRQAEICAVLDEMIQAPRDRDFIQAELKQRGWLQ